MIRGKTNSSILRNVAILQERYPQQSIKQDMAIALNVAGHKITYKRSKWAPTMARKRKDQVLNHARSGRYL